jgi:hypothetical protein
MSDDETKDDTKDSGDTADETEPAAGTSKAKGDEADGTKRSGVTIPAWVAGLVAALVLLGVGFGIGWVSNDGGGHDH